MTYPVVAQLALHMGRSLDSPRDDDVLAAARAFVERYTDRVFVAVAGTKKFRSPHRIGLRYLQLRCDLCTITSITNGDGTVLSAGDYFTHPSDTPPYDHIEIEKSAGIYWVLDQPILIEGTWGFSVDCPPDISYAILEVAASYYRAQVTGGAMRVTTLRQGGHISEGTSLSDKIWSILNNYRRVTF